MKKNIFDLIILFPFVWSFTGVFLYSSGHKSLVVFILLAVITSAYYYGLNTIKKRLKENKLLWLLAISSIFAICAYYNYGFGSGRLRTFIILFVYFLIIPESLIPKINLKFLTIIGAITASTFTFFQIYIYNNGRYWDINPITYSTFIASIAILALYFLLQSKTIKQSIIWIFILPPTFVCLFYSQARGLWLALLVAAVVLIIKTLITNKQRFLFLIPIIGIIFLSFSFSSEKISQRITQTNNEIQKIKNGNFNTSIGLRLQMWEAALYLSGESPILGLGDTHLRHKEELVKQGLIAHNIARFKHYHNQFINDFVRYGSVGLCLSMFFILLPVYYFFKYNSPYKWPGLLVVLTFFIAALTDVPFKYGNTLTFYLMIIYITLCAPHLTQNKEK